MGTVPISPVGLITVMTKNSVHPKNVYKDKTQT